MTALIGLLDGGTSGVEPRKHDGCERSASTRSSLVDQLVSPVCTPPLTIFTLTPTPHDTLYLPLLCSIPEEPLTELRSLAAYRQSHSNRCLLCTYAHKEVVKSDRVVVLDEASGFVALVPFWATWPFEIIVLPYKRHIADVTGITEDEALGLARVLKKVLTRYDNLFTSVRYILPHLRVPPNIELNLTSLHPSVFLLVAPHSHTRWASTKRPCPRFLETSKPVGRTPTRRTFISTFTPRSYGAAA
jgi:hypothetical protein